MATSVSRELIQVITEGQARMLDYLKRADERGERQSRATLKALAVLQDGQQVLHEGQKTMQEGQKTMQKTMHEGQKTMQKTMHEGQKTMAQMLIDMQAITVRVLELTRDIHSEVLDKKSSRH
jgi:exonuclease VII small subunit